MAVYLLASNNPGMLPGNFLFIENYIHSYLNDWNAHFWSLCVEVHFYIAIGITVATFGTRGIWILVPACVAVTLLRISGGVFIDIRTHLRVDEILAGACVALFFHRGLLNYRASNSWLVGALLFWFLASSEFTGPFQYFRPYSSGALLACVIGLSPSLALSILESRAGRYVAEISYALYVIHPATTHGWMGEGNSFQKYLLKRPISFALTFALAHLSTFYWEKRWIAWGKTLTVRKTAAALGKQCIEKPQL